MTINYRLWKKGPPGRGHQYDIGDVALHVCAETFTTSSILREKSLVECIEASGFVNDAIRTNVYSTRRKPIIPPYTAVRDRYAQAYFQSPLVQSIMERYRSSGTLKGQEYARMLNKLSVRRRCIPTPDNFKIRQMEKGFINDAIITEKKRTKYKDIIPPYDARQDKLCQTYFQREDVRRLINVTCAPRFTLGMKSKSLMT